MIFYQESPGTSLAIAQCCIILDARDLYAVCTMRDQSTLSHCVFLSMETIVRLKSAMNLQLFSFLLTSHIYYWDICKIAAMLSGCHIFHDYVYPFGILQT